MASQGPNNPSTGTNDTAVGTVAWANPTNIQNNSSDVTFSQVSISGSNQITNYLKATNFGFSIPVNSQIDGIEVVIRRRRTGAGSVSTFDNIVSVVKADGSIGSENKADTMNSWPTSFTDKSYGGLSDLWGETWTPADINDADFGFVLSALGNQMTTLALSQVVSYSVTVYYTEGATSGFNIALI